MFLTHSDEALDIEKFKRSRENKIEFAYDYGNLNASYVNEKINFEDDYFQEIINPDFEKINSPFQQTSLLKPYVPNVILEKIIIGLEDEVLNLLEKEKANLETIESLKSKGFESSESDVIESENQNENDCHKIEKVCDKEENHKVISPGMFKLNVSQCVSSISMSKSSCDSNNVEIKLKRKRHLDTFSSVRRPRHRDVIWKKKGSSNTFNVGLSAVSVSNLNKNVKRYSRKDLLACNNSHLGETSSAYMCNDALNVFCDSRMNDLLDDNNFFIFYDVNVRISLVSKMPFRKKPRDSMHIIQICLWIIDSGCSKHMTGNRALLMNFLEKFLGTVCFGNNYFAVIAGYGDVVIGSMMIKKVYYVEGLRHNLFSVGQFCDKGLEYATLMRHNKNLMEINIDALYNILKKNQGDVNDVMRSKKKTVVVTFDPLTLIVEKTNVSRSKEKVVVSSDSKGNDEKKRDMSKVKCYNCKKEGYFAKDCKKEKVKDYEYYKTKMLLAKKDKDEQVLLAEDQAWMESSSDSDHEINANMVFMAQIEKVLSDSEASSSSADEKISKEIINLDFDKIDSPFRQTSSLKPYVPNVILEKIIIDLEYEVVNLLEKEKVNLETIESLKSKGVESSETVSSESENQSENDCLVVEKEYEKEENPKVIAPGMFKLNVSQCVSLISMSKSSCDSNNVEIKLKRKRRCSKHITGNRALLTNFMEKFLGTVRFGSNDFAVIAGYGDVVIGSMTIKKIYYVEGLGHNLFSIGQFYVKGLEVGFRKSTCFVRNEDGVDLLTGDRSSNLYTIALNEVASNSSSCILAKASSSQSWLWHQRLSHLNFATINNLVKNNLVQGLPKMKFEKDNLCSTCEKGNIHQKHHKSKTAFASNKPLYILHLDLCGPIRVQNEASEVIISFFKNTQVNLQLQVQCVQTDSSTEFKNKTLAKFFDEVDITQQFFAARTPQQNSVVERRNRTLVEAARTILTFANLPSFLWAEAIAIACFTQNRSIIYKRFDKTPYELINKRKANIKFFCVFGCRCYLLNDYEDVGKLKVKENIGVFVGYSKESVAFRIYNKRTRKIHKSVNVNFDKISEMASKQFSLEHGLSNLNEMGKSSNLSVLQVDEASKKDLEDLFQDFYDEYLDSSKIMKSSTTNVETSINDEIVQICLWIIDSGCLKRMMGNRALLTNFVEKFLGTVRFGNNDFAVIPGYGDVVIGKIHKKHHKSKTAFASNNPLYLLHMDLCRPMRIQSINGKRYVLVVIDDYSWYTWVFFLHSKDEASEVINSFIKKTQVNLQLQVQRVRTDNGTEFKNKALAKFCDEAEAIATACFTQNHSIIHKRFDKTHYELTNKRKPNIKFFRVFGCRCYLLNDYEDLGKLKAKGDIKLFVGYSKESAAFRIYNKRTRKIHKSMNVNFDEISEMASKQFSLEPGLSNLNKIGKSSKLSVSQVDEASKKDLEDLFQDFYDEYFDSSKIMKSSTTNVETSINDEVFHEISESFQGESSSSSLNDDVQHMERRNRTLVEATRTMLTFSNLPSFLWDEAIATACFTQNRSIIHKRYDKTPYELMNKRKPNIKFFRVFGCRCYLLNDYENVGKLKAKGDIEVFVGYSKESAAFKIYNKRTRKIHESVNVNFDEISEMDSKQFSLEHSLSNLNKTGKSSNPSVSQVSEASKNDLEDLFHDFYDEYFDSSKIMKSSTTNVQTSINEEVFHEVSESFQRESSSSSLNDDVQQSLEEVILPQTNTQSISNNMIPNVDKTSTSHNVFNERLEDAYFDASTSFHDPSNVHTYYQPYPHEKKWTKDHPLHKIISDPKSSVRTRGQLANSCLFLCLLSSIEPANVAEALRDADWVSTMQEELDQFARLKV
nr:hypothetical protein [Tanacetum cinerariifolium]